LHGVRLTWFLLLCSFSWQGCDETAVFLRLHSKLKIPEHLDALCLQLTAGNEVDFQRRYPLSAAEAGSPLTLSILPGQRHSSSFEALIQGQRRGWQVSWRREQLAFESNSVVTHDVDINHCSGGAGQGTFTYGGRLTDKPGSAVAAVPVAYARDQVVVAWSQEARRFAFLDKVKQPGEGLPTVPLGQINDLLAVDVDNDCDLDLILLHRTGPILWKHDGNGKFTPQTNAIQVSGEYTAAAAADLNLDGFVDLLLASPVLGAGLLLNNGQRAGTFTDASSLLPDQELDATGVAVGFLNKDGYTDVVFSRGSSSDQTNSVLLNQYNAGKLSFSRESSPEKKQTLSVALGDFNRDGLHDLVYGNSGESPSLYMNASVDAKLVLKARALSTSVGKETANAILAADLDDDCDVDLVLARDNAVMVLLNDGAGIFIDSGSTGLGGARRLALADLSGDGALDLVFGGSAGGATYYLQAR
jgi:FG-GAP-like repeat